jgi:hypothetical protein
MQRNSSESRGGKPLSAPLRASVYIVCAVILALCAFQIVQEPDQLPLYGSLGIIAVGYGVFILIMDIKNRRKSGQRKISQANKRR